VDPLDVETLELTDELGRRGGRAAADHDAPEAGKPRTGEDVDGHSL
jgi:hypothetical protein